MGRTPSLTPEIGEAICVKLREGTPKFPAAAECGVSRASLNRWLNAGKDVRAKISEGYTPKGHDQLYLNFLDAYELAWDQGEAHLISEARRTANNGGKWGFFITMLERTRRADWSPHTKIEQSGAGGGPLKVTLAFDAAELPDMTLAEQ